MQQFKEMQIMLIYPIRIVAVGRVKITSISELELHYKKILGAFVRLTMIEVPNGRGCKLQQLKQEAESILAQIKNIQCPIILSPDGNKYTSELFASWLRKKIDYGLSIAFIIGSSNGFDSKLSSTLTQKLSLSSMTFPHDLSRILLLEQLYRAFSIISNTKYHK